MIKKNYRKIKLENSEILLISVNVISFYFEGYIQLYSVLLQSSELLNDF